MFNVECNGVLVVEFDTSECESYWELQIKQFAFEYRDDASEYYRIVSQGKTNDILIFLFFDLRSSRYWELEVVVD